MIRAAFLILLAAAPAAAAQQWQAFEFRGMSGAGICTRPMAHAADGTYCLSVVCEGDGGPFLDLSFLRFTGLPLAADLAYSVGSDRFGDRIEATIDDNVTAYRLDLEDAWRQALMAGASVDVRLGDDDTEDLLDMTFPLAGSGDAIRRADELCSALAARRQEAATGAPQPAADDTASEPAETEAAAPAAAGD